MWFYYRTKFLFVLVYLWKLLIGCLKWLRCRKVFFYMNIMRIPLFLNLTFLLYLSFSSMSLSLWFSACRDVSERETLPLSVTYGLEKLDKLVNKPSSGLLQIKQQCKIWAANVKYGQQIIQWWQHQQEHFEHLKLHIYVFRIIDSKPYSTISP